MWKDFVEVFGWRFQGVEGYQAAQMWVSEIKNWVEYQEAQHRMHLTAYRRGLALLFSINIVLLAMFLFLIGGK